MKGTADPQLCLIREETATQKIINAFMFVFRINFAILFLGAIDMKTC